MRFTSRDEYTIFYSLRALAFVKDLSGSAFSCYKKTCLQLLILPPTPPPPMSCYKNFHGKGEGKPLWGLYLALTEEDAKIQTHFTFRLRKFVLFPILLFLWWFLRYCASILATRCQSENAKVQKNG